MKNKIVIGLSFFIFAACAVNLKKKTDLSVETAAVTPAGNISFQILTELGRTQIEADFSSKNPDLKKKEIDGLAVNSQTVSFAVIGNTVGASSVLLQSLAQEKVDFIILTGNFSKSTDWQGCAKNFFIPFQKVLEKVPFLFVSGSNESCTVVSSVAETVQWIEIGNLVLVNLDTSSFDGTTESKAFWLKKLKELTMRVQAEGRKKEIWLLTHKPILAFLPSADDAEPVALVQPLQEILTEAGLFSKIDYILSGELHSQQVVCTEPHVKQFIVGDSGDSLTPFGRKIIGEKIISGTENRNSFGYAVFERQGLRKWQILFKDSKGNAKLSCHLNQQKLLCD